MRKLKLLMATLAMIVGGGKLCLGTRYSGQDFCCSCMVWW